MNAYDEIFQTYSEKGNTYGFYYFGSKTNIRDFFKHVDILADNFIKMGLKKGDCFTIYLPNCIQGFAAFYALNKIGAISNIVHPLTPMSTVKDLQKQTKSKGIILLDILVDNFIDEVNALKTNIIVARNSDYVKGIKKPFIKLFEHYKACNVSKINNATFYRKIIKKKKYDETVSASSPRRLAVYIHSGGTTGSIKTIKLSNYAMTSLIKQLNAVDNNPAQKKYTPIVLPMFHAYGLVANMHASVVQGYNSIIFPKFNGKSINKAIRKYKVSMIISVPLMISKLMQDKRFYGKHLRHLKTVYCGGDTVSNTLQTNFNKAVAKYGGTAKLLPGYGLTEICSVISVNTEQDYKFGSVGKALAGNTIQIWGSRDRVLKNNRIGEIVATGPTIMMGYLNSEDNGITEVKGKKWVKTGDLGFIDKEGFVYIIGRKKRLIKIASFNIFPSQIEEVVAELPFINEVCAIESTKQSRKVVKLVVSLKGEKLDYNHVSKRIFEHCSNNLIKYSVPTELQIIDELPRTKMSKIDFVKIEQLYG